MSSRKDELVLERLERAERNLEYALYNRWGAAGSAPGTPGYNPAWYAIGDIWLDPADSSGVALNSNPGTQALPLVNISEVCRRWGSRTPLIPGLFTRLHIMSSQSTAQAVSDPFGNFGPVTPEGSFAIIGVPQAFGAPFPCGAVTQISRANPGNSFTVAGMPVGAAAGMLLLDTVANSVAIIFSMSGSTATCGDAGAANGLTAPPGGTEDGAAWTIGDTCQLYSGPTIYMDQWSHVANSLATNQGNSQLLNLVFGDISGTHSSQLAIAPVAQNVQIGNCVFDAQTTFAGLALNSAGNQYLLNSLLLAPAEFYPNWAIYGGGFSLTGAVTLHGHVTIRNDVICQASANVVFEGPTAKIANIHIPAGFTLQIQGPTFFTTSHLIANPAMWGGGTCTAWQGGLLENNTGSSWATVTACNLQLTSHGSTTGTSYNPGTGVWTSGITVNAANIDSNLGLQEPISGARFSGSSST